MTPFVAYAIDLFGMKTLGCIIKYITILNSKHWLWINSIWTFIFSSASASFS